MRTSILLFGVYLTACGQSALPSRGVPVTFQSVCDKANQGKRVMIEGYVDFPLREVPDSAAHVVMRVRPSLSSWENTVGADARIGKGPNSIEMPPEGYKNRDLRLHLSDGQLVGYSNKTKVSGTVYAAHAEGPGEYWCALSDTLYERGSGYQPAAPK
ncbi:MAG TPA: hypothetical protein VML19_25515 [Verrucomicrobiae bacterium]|nr:hypothetical protein [Verrucomicrobiae bacterium]